MPCPVTEIRSLCVFACVLSAFHMPSGRTPPSFIVCLLAARDIKNRGVLTMRISLITPDCRTRIRWLMVPASRGASWIYKSRRRVSWFRLCCCCCWWRLWLKTMTTLSGNGARYRPPAPHPRTKHHHHQHWPAVLLLLAWSRSFGCSALPFEDDGKAAVRLVRFHLPTRRREPYQCAAWRLYVETSVSGVE